MSWYGLVSFCAVYIAAVATPGPGVAAVIARSLARGHKGAAAFISGFVVGDLIWFAGAGLGLSALAQSAHSVFLAVKYAGAAYLLFIAFKLWTTPGRPLADAADQSLDQRPLKLFLGSLTLTLGNPKPMLFFVALLPTLVPLEHLNVYGYLQIALAIAVILPSILGAYVLIASRARRWFRSARANTLVNRGSGTLLAAAAAAVAAR
jgi:threonine/homoserine/homoserine lactone efflux protein